jgi:LmbE family N-acetylglucosaminyl deacetylase
VRRVACVFAHPDDDTFGVAGSFALHAGDDLELTVILATSGDAGRIADAALATRETLASVREAEDLDSWRARGLEPMNPTPPFVPRGVPDGTIGARIDVSSIYDRKVEAIRAHRTQAELDDVPFDLWPEMLSTEAFVVAWPERRPRDPILADLFEGLASS